MYVRNIVKEEVGYKDTSVSKKATVKDNRIATEATKSKRLALTGLPDAT